MKILKNITSLMLAMSVIFGMCNLESFATENERYVSSDDGTEETSGFDENAHGEIIKEGNCGGEYDAQYKLYEDGTLYIYGNRRNIISCAELRSLGVKRVYIEDGVSAIQNEAFKNFLSLKNIEIPDSVKSIGAVCFYGCESLEEIEIPREIKSIEISTFSGCSSLKKVRARGTIESIGGSSFCECENLEDIEFIVTSSGIGDYAFYGCNSLKEVLIPYSVKLIGTQAFSKCSGLERVEILGPALSLQGTTSSYIYYEAEFSECENLKEVIMHYGSNRLCKTFYGCVNLELIEIPNSVTKISKDSFYACGKLTIRCPEGSYAETFAKENDIIIDLIHTHKYESAITKEPTCTEKGIKTYTCSCGDEYTEGMPATGHDEVIDPATAPTEMEEGKTEGSHCKTCGKILKEQEIIPTTGKTEEPEKPTKPEIQVKNTFNGCKGSPVKLSISCKENDEFTFECIDGCGMESKYTGYSSMQIGATSFYSKGYSLTFDISGEHIISVYKNGKITENGKIIIAENHTWDSGKTESNPTCTKNGKRKYTCSNCENSYTEEIVSTGHEYIENITKKVTCTSDGVKKYTCSKCRDSYTKTVPRTGHKYGEWKVYKNPTIFKSGKNIRKCSNCRKTESKSIKKLKSSVSIKKKVSIKAGKKITIRIIKKSKGDTVSNWKSSKKSVAIVNKKGKVTAKKKGTAKITVKMKSGCKATCTVKVK